MARGATLLAATALWLWAASLLLRTSVPHLHLPQLDRGRSSARARAPRRALRPVPGDRLAAAHCCPARGARCGGGPCREASARARPHWLGNRPGRARGYGGLGRALPFHLAALWWRRRYGIVHESYGPWVAGQVEALLVTAGAGFVAVVVVTALAAWLGRRWWLAAAPLAAAAALAVTFAGAWLETGHAPRAAR